MEEITDLLSDIEIGVTNEILNGNLHIENNIENFQENNNLKQPTNINKWIGSIYEFPTKNKLKMKYEARVRLNNKRETKLFNTRNDAENYIKEFCLEHNEPPSNCYYDMGDHYKVFIDNIQKWMLIDKDDYYLIEDRVVYTKGDKKKNKNYPAVWEDGKDVMLHNLIMNFLPSENKGEVVDHIGHIEISKGILDNRKSNLRIVSNSVNAMNAKFVGSKTGTLCLTSREYISESGSYTIWLASFSYEGVKYKKYSKDKSIVEEWLEEKRKEIIPEAILNSLNNREIKQKDEEEKKEE